MISFINTCRGLENFLSIEKGVYTLMKNVYGLLFLLLLLTGCSTTEKFGPVSESTSWTRVEVLGKNYRVFKVENEQSLYGSIWDSNLMPPYHVTHGRNRVLAIEKHTGCRVDPKSIVVLLGETTLANVDCKK